MHALAGLLQLFLSFLVSELSVVESLVCFFPRRKRAIVGVRLGRKPGGVISKGKRDGTAQISRRDADDTATGRV